MNRRTFLMGSGGALASLAVSGRAAANDRIGFGFIGLGGMGTGRLQEFMKHADVNVAAVCDLDDQHLNRAADLVKQAGRPDPVKFHDFRKLLESKDIDAVMVATPDHWHALPVVTACRAGKDVFVEKPLSYSIGEGRAMANAARDHKRITQMGNHIHNDLPNYRRVVEIVRSGALGKIDRVEVWKTSETKGLGKPPDGPPPAGLDYDFWLGPAPKRAYNPNRSHATYRYFWDYSGGVFIDFFCHITDLVYWALDLKAPLSVAAVGRRELPDDNGETPNNMAAIFNFPNLVMNWTLHPNPPAGFGNMHIGCAFQGSEATLVADYETHKVFVKGKEVPDFPKPAQSIQDSPGHIREFLNSIKSRELTTCNVEYGHRLTKGGLLADIALRTGRTLRWDDAKEVFPEDKAAQAMVMRQYRKPWKIA